MTPDPARANKWLGLLLPLMERGGPILSLFLLLTMVVSGWYMMRELGRARAVNRELYERLLVATEARASLATRCPGGGPK
jgi:hypothetical protein